MGVSPEEWVRPGQVIAGRFRVVRVLGQGGMGVVVEAQHLQLGEPVALKFLKAERAGRRGAARLLREARIVARLRSEHIARVLDVDTLPSGQPFVVMERLVGSDLSVVLGQEKILAADRAILLMLQACEAVVEAHTLGVVHRDLKPSNLFLVASPGGSDRLKVLDFGISKISEQPGEQHLTDSLSIVGSPQYMAPEQIRDPRLVDGRADVWSLGVVLFEMLSGRRPFEAPTSAGLLITIVTEAPAPLPATVDPRLAAIVLRCLEKSPERRYPSVLALAEALAPLGPPAALVALARVREASLRVGANPDAHEPEPSGEQIETSPAATTRGGTSVATLTAPLPPAPVSPGLSSARSRGLAALGGGGLVTLLLAGVLAASPTSSAPVNPTSPVASTAAATRVEPVPPEVESAAPATASVAPAAVPAASASGPSSPATSSRPPSSRPVSPGKPRLVAAKPARTEVDDGDW